MSNPPISEFKVGRRIKWSDWQNEYNEAVITEVLFEEHLFKAKLSDGGLAYFSFDYPLYEGYWIFLDDLSLPEDLID